MAVLEGKPLVWETKEKVFFTVWRAKCPNCRKQFKALNEKMAQSNLAKHLQAEEKQKQREIRWSTDVESVIER